MLIEIKGVSITIDETVILKDVDFHVNEGDLVFIVGRVGSGKSSLLKTIYAEMDYDEGSIKVLDFNLDDLKRRHIPELRRKMGIVFQDFALLRHQTVHQNLDFVLRATGWKNKEERDVRIKEVLEQVGLFDRLERYPHELSGGEQQRIAIARALLNHPRLVVADEPTGNLDAQTARDVMELLSNLTKNGTAVVVVTHNMDHLRNFPSRVYECSNKTVHEALDPIAVADSFKLEEAPENE